MTMIAAKPFLYASVGDVVRESARFGRILRAPRAAALEQAIGAVRASTASDRTPALQLASLTHGDGPRDQVIAAKR